MSLIGLCFGTGTTSTLFFLDELLMSLRNNISNARHSVSSHIKHREES